MNTNSITLRMPPELRAKVETVADEERRPVSQLIRNVIEDFVEARRGKSRRHQEAA